MCFNILFHNFYFATLSFSIGFIIGFWNLQWSWIRLCRSSHLRGVLENRCSEIYSQNPWKIPMKKFIFSKVACWLCATFSYIPWGFYLIKKFVKICFKFPPVCCFVMFTPAIKFNFNNGWFEHRKVLLGIWDKDWHLIKRQFCFVIDKSNWDTIHTQTQTHKNRNTFCVINTMFHLELLQPVHC